MRLRVKRWLRSVTLRITSKIPAWRSRMAWLSRSLVAVVWRVAGMTDLLGGVRGLGKMHVAYILNVHSQPCKQWPLDERKRSVAHSFGVSIRGAYNRFR